MSRRYVARNRLGSVTMSPAAVTIGAATLSRSRLRRAQYAATATVSASTTIEEMMAPITDTTMKSTTEIVDVCRNASDITLASTASTAEIAIDDTSAAAMFWPTSVSIRRLSRNVPA